MLYLSETTQKLRVVLGAAVTDTQLAVVCAYGRKTGLVYEGKTFTAVTNNTTAVDITDAPSSGQIIEVNHICVTNLDSVPAVVTVQFHDSAASTTPAHTSTINPGDKLEYSHQGGWRGIDSGCTQKIGPPGSIGSTTFKYSTELISEPISEDLDGETIQSSSYELFKGVKVVPVDVIRVVCTRNSYDATTDKDPYIQHVNSVDLTLGGKVYEAGEAILWDLTVTEYEVLGDHLYLYEYVFKGRTDMTDPWQIRPFDEGFYTWDNTANEWAEITSGAGTPVARPVLLDGAGDVLDPETGTPVRLNFRRYDEADLGAITFP